MVRVPIRFGWLKPIFLAAGITTRTSYLHLGPGSVRVRMGWLFSAEIPRVFVQSALRVRNSQWSIGVRGWRGRWIVNGAAGPMAAITIDPPARARVLGIPVAVRELRVSVEDPDALIADLAY